MNHQKVQPVPPPAPVALFAYNRPVHTTRTLNALRRNPLADETHLYIFCDGPRDNGTDRVLVDEVRRLAGSEQWCGRVTLTVRERNLGLAASIRSGVHAVLQAHDRIIVLEDDIQVSSGFLKYMNDALTLYANVEAVMNVSAYIPSTSYQQILPESFFLRHMSCWGWATWRRAWEKATWDAEALVNEISKMPGGIRRFDLDGCYPYSRQLQQNIDGSLSTWAIFWLASIYVNEGLSLFPHRSLVSNIGVDGSGEHCSASDGDIYDVRLVESIDVRLVRLRESIRGRFYLKSFFRFGRDATLMTRLKRSGGRIKHKLATSIRRWLG